MPGGKDKTGKGYLTCISLPIYDHTDPASPDGNPSYYPKSSHLDSRAGGLPSLRQAGLCWMEPSDG